LKGIFWFVLKFFAVFFVLEALLVGSSIPLLQEPIASLEAGLLGLESEGNIILSEGGNFEISPSCTGLVSSIILAAIIFSLKKPEIKKKIGIFLAGSVSLLVLNLFRIYLVILGGELFGFWIVEPLHILSWFATTALILVLWYYLTMQITGIRNFSGFL